MWLVGWCCRRDSYRRQAGRASRDQDHAYVLGGLPELHFVPVVWRDGAEHSEHREQTAKYFTPRRVNMKFSMLLAHSPRSPAVWANDQGTAVTLSSISRSEAYRHALANGLSRSSGAPVQLR